MEPPCSSHSNNAKTNAAVPQTSHQDASASSTAHRDTQHQLHSFPDASPNENAPATVADAKAILRQFRFNNTMCKQALRMLNIMGVHNAKLVTKVTIIATKMVQKTVSGAALSHLLQRREGDSNRDYSGISNLPGTTVRVKKDSQQKIEVLWIKGDVPVFNNDEVVVGKPSLSVETNATEDTEGREPAFQAVEYCRLLHVLADARLTATRRKLMECMTREELDKEQEDPWTDSIAPLFNDGEFKPEAVSTLSGGVTRSDIAYLDPSRRPHIRNAGVLKRKFGAFKSLYGTCLSRYEASGQGEPEAFASFADGKSYIMYAFCFLKVHPILEPLATRALSTDARREEGVGAPLKGYGFGGRVNYGPRSKRSRTSAANSSSSAIEGLASAFRPQNSEVAKEFEEAERDKMRYEAFEADARFTKATVDAIAAVRTHMENTSDDEEKTVLQQSLRRLLSKLGNK